MWYNDAVNDLAYKLAQNLAAVLLRGRTDKAGVPAFDHAQRVRELLASPDSDQAAIVAWLHDLVEDTPLTLPDLEGFGFSPGIIAVVDALTRRAEETYADYIDRVSRDPVARRVKIADLTDHLTRAHLIPGGMKPSLVSRYMLALGRLGVHYEQHEASPSPHA